MKLIEQYLNILNENKVVDKGQFLTYEQLRKIGDEALEKKNVSCGIIVKNNDNMEPTVLLIQRAADDHWPLHWEAPRGGCDGGNDNNKLDEPLVKCLKREIKEESGLDVEPIKYIGQFKYMGKGGTRESTQFNYLCKMIDPNQKVRLSHEHEDYKWVATLGEIQTMVNAGEMRDTIIKAFQMFEDVGSQISQPKNPIDDYVDKVKENYAIKKEG